VSLADQAAQHKAHLVIAAEVAEIRAQKHVAAFAGNALHDAGFQIFSLHIVSNDTANILQALSNLTTVQ
jgi:hypothetical protein